MRRLGPIHILYTGFTNAEGHVVLNVPVLPEVSVLFVGSLTMHCMLIAICGVVMLRQRLVV